MSHFLKQKKSI